jgi:hypothetical protein
MLTSDQKFQLEDLLDATSVMAVVAALAEICHEKAEHIRTTYQDRVTAASWNKAGNVLNHIDTQLSQIGV